MKIGIAVWNLDISGGTERQALELARQMQRNGHDVEVYCAYFDPVKCFPDFIREVKNIRFLEPRRQKRDSMTLRTLFYWDLFSKRSKDLGRLMSSDLDVLNCHEYTTFIAGTYFNKATGVPVVGMINDVPSVGGVYVPRDDPWRFPLSWLKRELFRSAIKSMDRLVVLDEINRGRLERHYRVDSVIVRSGLDLDRFAFKERKSCSEQVRILSNGNFFPWRRYEDLIGALRILVHEGVPFHMNHIGTDALCASYASKIKRLVERYQLSDFVTFHGYVNEKRFFEIYSTSDVFVFPNYPQTWGLAVFEAMGCGIPVIVNSGCGAAEVLRDRETALIVPPRSPSEIAKAIRRLVEDADLYSRLSRKGRDLVEKEISWEIYGDKMLEQFHEVARSRGQRRG